MAQIEVVGYTRHQSGKLVTVRGYEQANNGKGYQAAHESILNHRVRQIPRSKPHQLAAEQGIFKARQYFGAEYTRGLSPHAAFPAGRTHPVILWLSHSVPNLLSLSAASDWTDAVREAIDHILLVVQNNPGKAMTDILARPDVQEALSAAGTEGATAVIQELERIWSAAGAPDNSPYLSTVVGTMQSNGASFASRMTDALSQAQPDDAQTLLLRDSLRASAAESVVRTRAEAEAKLATLKRAGVTHVKWQARRIRGTDEFEPNVCTTCRTLDGDIVPIGTSFDLSVLQAGGLRPYGGLFYAPPAHPQCNCKLVAA